MLYYALFDYLDRTIQDDESRHRRETRNDVVVFTMVVEACDEDRAKEKLKEKLAALHEESELFYDVDQVYLDDIVVIDEAPFSGALVHWMSVLPFGNGLASFIRPCWSDGEMPDGEEEGEESFAEPFVDFERDHHVTRPLYKELSRRKERDTLLSFEELSEGDLYALYVHEGCTDKEIARLFDIEVHRVTYRRRKTGASIAEEALVDMLKEMGELELGAFLQ